MQRVVGVEEKVAEAEGDVAAAEGSGAALGGGFDVEGVMAVDPHSWNRPMLYCTMLRIGGEAWPITLSALHPGAADDISMPISTDIIVRIAHADVAMGMAFPRTIDHWQRKENNQDTWKVLPGNCDSILIGQNDGVVIDGNCTNRVSAPDGGLIHIYGDLMSKIDLGGHHEVIITGDVGPNALIEASGFCHVFISGQFCGALRLSGSAKIWIGSVFSGTIETGMPSTELHIGGDYDGNVSPTETAALLYLMVAGFASHASLSKVVDCGYTQFHASIARSDVAPGLYPLDGYHRKTSRGNSFNRWCVEAGS